jgi:hypothetical protein
MSFRDKKRSGDLKGYLIIGLVVALLSIAAAYLFINEGNKVKIDPITFCPTEESEQFGKTVALLDLTDPLNKAQKEFFLKEIKELKDQIPKHHSLTIYTLDEDLDLNKSRKITMCNPGTVEDIESTYDKISINPNEIKKRWVEGFSKQISDVVNNIMFDNNSQNTSPVMEMFQLIAINEFKGFEGVDNEIIILSDMIQNTPEMSMYQNGLISFSKFKKSDYFSKVRTNLNKNVTIKLFIIKRDGSRAMQGDEDFTNFWFSYFYEGNNSKKNIERTFVDG